MVSNARERKHDCLARQIATAKLVAAQFAELAELADHGVRNEAQRYAAFWRGIAVRRKAEMTGGERQALKVKP